jgi:hypothetical protein
VVPFFTPLLAYPQIAWRVAAHVIRCRRLAHRPYDPAVAKRRDPHHRHAPDPAALLAKLRSPDEQTRIKALHAVCPCASGFQAYEHLRCEVKRLQKDPSPRVRAMALHVEQDACRIERIAAELETADTQGRSPRDQNWASGQRQRLATRYYLPL